MDQDKDKGRGSFAKGETVLNVIFIFLLSLPVLFLYQNCGLEAPSALSSDGTFSNFDHSAVLHLQCMQCHEDERKNPQHYPGQDCKGCHIPGGTWKPPVGGSPHIPLPSACAGCHGDGGPEDRFEASLPGHSDAIGKDCIECHQSAIDSGFTNWGGGSFFHSPQIIAAQNCKSCHGDGQANDKYPNNHLPVMGGECFACHKKSTENGFANWTGAVMVHNKEIIDSQVCNSCHADGAPRDSFPANHQNIGSKDCFECHQAAINNGFTSWGGGKFEHTQAIIDAKNCQSCHGDGQSKDSFPANHIATNGQDCSSCHQSSINNGFTSWAGGRFTHSSTIINAKNCNSCHESDRPKTGAYMSQDENLSVNHSHYGKFDCYFCHGTNNSFRDWNSSNTNHYNAAGSKIQHCLPCHYSRERPQANQASNGKISEHRNNSSYFTAPVYDINAVGNQPNSSGKLGNCYRCHSSRRNF